MNDSYEDNLVPSDESSESGSDSSDSDTSDEYVIEQNDSLVPLDDWYLIDLDKKYSEHLKEPLVVLNPSDK